MFIISVFDTKALANVQNHMQSIDLNGRLETSITDEFSALELDNKLLGLLKTFNNRIIKVDTEVQQYSVKTKDGKTRRLGFNRFSTGERLFVICFMAHETQTAITIQNEIDQLDMKHIKMFFKLWGNSPYIDVILNQPSKKLAFETLINR